MRPHLSLILLLLTGLSGAQVWEKLCGEVGDTEALMERGEFGPILGWLQERIYSQARRYEPKELVKRVTGDEMRPDAWIRYAKSKYRGLYGLDPFLTDTPVVVG